MELFSQLYNAISGHGAAQEQTNDTDDEHTWTLNGALPSNPFSQASSTTQIDLTSPTRQAPPQPRTRPANADTAQHSILKQGLADERRLIGDFHIPADRVSAPDPHLLWQTAPRPAMGKPAAGRGLRPIDTLNATTSAIRSSRPIDYGKSSRNARNPRIGYVSGPGQEEYMARTGVRSLHTPSRTTPSRQAQSYRSGEASPLKRRKTGHASAQEVIDFTEDDHPRVGAPHHAATSVARQHDVSRPNQSSQSRRSVDSGTTLVGRQPKAPIMSEFKATGDLVRRSIARSKQQSPDPQYKSSYGRSVSGSVTPHTQDTPIHIPDDEPVAPISIFDDFQQGVSDGTPEERKAQNKRNVTTSHHFPNARINESTADAGKQTTTVRKSNLRNFKPVQREVVDVDPISDDELAMDLAPKKNMSTRRQASPSKISQTANRGVKRRTKVEETSEGWPLFWARTHDLVLHGNNVGDLGPPTLRLLDGEEPGTWNIVEYDATHPSGVTRACITPKDVIRGQADHTGRIRLEGPRSHDGNSAIFDLDFKDPADFRKFRDEHASPLTFRNKLTDWEPEQMAALFLRPLHKNNKVGTSTLVDDSVSAVSDESPAVNWPSKTPLLDHVRGAGSNPAANINRGSASTTRSSARTTRSVAPLHDVEEIHQEPAVEKYSIVYGLGTPWLSPLTYGNSRQKSVVDFNDLPRLDEEEMLNDSLIDFYMIWLFDKYKIPKDKVYFFNTYFYTKLTEKTGRSSMNYEAVKRWTAKIDIFGFDYIVVPIHEATHWYLAIICNVNNIERKLAQEDFDEGAVEEFKAALPEAHATVGSTTAPEAQPDATPQASISPENEGNQQDGSDANLFDEEGSLNLVNPDETGDEQHQHTHISSIPQSPGEAAQASELAPPALDQDAVPISIFSKLSAPAERKKKSKRKPPVTKRDPSQPVIIVLDSLGNPHSNTVRSLKDWLAAEGLERRSMEAEIKGNGVYPKGDLIPVQSNWSDCGVYVLGYVEKFFQNPDEFKRKLLTGEMTPEDDWPELKPKEMRTDLRNLLFKIAKEQELTKPKKRKGKKASTPAKKVSPIKAQLTNAEHQASPALQATRAGLADISTAPAKTAPVEMQPIVVEKDETNELPRLRLQSPFNPKAHTDACLARDKSPEFVVGTVSDPPPASPALFVKRTSLSPQKKTPGRRMNPEVRIPARSPAPQQLLQKSHHIEVASTSIFESPHEPARDTRSMSPLKRSRQVADDDDLVRTPASRKKAKSTSAEKQRLSSRMNGDRDGSSDNPIEIMDSQDVNPKTTQSPGGFRTGSPAKRKPPSRSPRKSDLRRAPSVEEMPSLSRIPDKTQSLRHAPSIEEISPYPPRETPRKRRQPEADSVSNLLESKLDADDKVLDQAKEAAVLASLACGEEYEADPMDIDSEGGHPMDTAADDVIRETPEPARRSPSWSKSQPLPM
ncbi:hypothetical protein CC86DRAFT_455383 [Ophiobolus disseminans]|uniref:Ubiquitin-like protease family profile domain-containing protein n=1 Tax=Ophiobolus disseminans TaxID=1469910 RepID=A0A6A7A035_9PLEO|nr:hypothetical protein CC86DRAFT_455383 [Ophiobolus disseminans]